MTDGKGGSSGVPEGWKVKSLAEISSISSGSTPSRSESEYWDGDIPWVTTGEISYNAITATNQHITQLGFEASSLKMYGPGTILMAMYGQGVTRGRIARLEISATINQACCAIAIEKDIDPHFIYSQLEYLYSHIRTLGHGGNQQNLNGEIIKQIAVKLPPLEEQRKIAEILSAWDEAIEQQTQLVELKRERKRGLMQQLLTGRVRFREFAGLEWSKARLGSLCSIQTGKKDVNQGNPNGEFPFFTCAKESTLSDGYSYDMEAILIAGNGAIGTSHYYKGKFEAYQRTYILSGFKASINVRFLLEWIRHDFVNTVLGFKQESAMPYIRLPTLQNFDIPLPSLPEQQKTANVLAAADAEIETLSAQLSVLKTQKRGLMQRLLTGQTRVQVA